MPSTPRDDNRIPHIVGTSSVDGETSIPVYANPTTNALKVENTDITTNQATLNSLIETLQELSQRLAPLAGAMASNAALRIAPISSVSTAVTGSVTATGGGYITSTQAVAALLTQTNTLWINNLMAVHSNVENCTGV